MLIRVFFTLESLAKRFAMSREYRGLEKVPLVYRSSREMQYRGDASALPGGGRGQNEARPFDVNRTEHRVSRRRCFCPTATTTTPVQCPDVPGVSRAQRAGQFLITFTRTQPVGFYLYEDRTIRCKM